MKGLEPKWSMGTVAQRRMRLEAELSGGAMQLLEDRKQHWPVEMTGKLRVVAVFITLKF